MRLVDHSQRDLTMMFDADTVDSWDNLYSFFVKRVRYHLHVILCLSPIGNDFSRRAQQFPALTSGVSIDWYHPWPDGALRSVASKYLDVLAMACATEVRLCV